MVSILQKVRDSLALKRNFTYDTSFEAIPTSLKSAALEPHQEEEQTHRVSRRNSYAEFKPTHRLSSIIKLKRRRISKDEDNKSSPMPRIATKSLSQHELPVKGGSLFASNVKDKLLECYRTLERRRRLPIREAVGEVDLGYLIRNIENSPAVRKDLSVKPRSISPIKCSAKDQPAALTDRQRLLSSTGRQRRSSRSKTSVGDTLPIFMTTVTCLKAAKDLSENSQPRVPKQGYTDKLESLKSACSNELLHRSLSNRLLSLQDNALHFKIAKLKADLKPHTGYIEDYADEQIAEFHREKKAFIYGKEFKGRFLRNSNI